MTLQEAWEKEAANWVRWARAPGHDSYWTFHRELFLSALPPPGRLTLDVGCGEGRVTRDLRELGHTVIGIDSAPSMIAAALEADPGGEYVEADAAALPFADDSADLVVGFMSLMDMDDMAGAVREIGRVLDARGRFVAAVLHPVNSAGKFSSREDDHARFRIDDYLTQRRFSDYFERDGYEMTFDTMHFTLEDYSRALENGGFLVEQIRELYDDKNPRWRRVPLFLRWAAVRA